MAAYVIVDLEVTDPAAYEEYRLQAPASITQYGGRYLVRGGACQVIEGDWQPGRVVVLEFPSVERVKEWYASAEYQAILPIRLRNSRSRLIIVEGVGSSV